MHQMQKILRPSVALALAGIASTTGSAQETNAQPKYDLVIRGGRVLDGAGNPCIFADVAIKEGRL